MVTVKDISKLDLRGYRVGDTFETRGLLWGVDKEPLVWRLSETTTTKDEFIFSVSYHGIFVGDYCITKGVAVELA